MACSRPKSGFPTSTIPHSAVASPATSARALEKCDCVLINRLGQGKRKGDACHFPLPTHTAFPCLASPTLRSQFVYNSPAGRPHSIMQQTRTRAIQSLKGSRNFSSSAQRAAVSPFKRPAQAAATKVVKDDVRRTQSTAAAAAPTATRNRPSPAFNREDYQNVSPLKPYRAPEMDHSFVGMTGGEIFHEMMLRQGVKHICTTPPCN